MDLLNAERFHTRRWGKICPELLWSPFQHLLLWLSGDKEIEQYKLTSKVDPLMGKGLLSPYMQRVKWLCQYPPVLIILRESRTWLEANDNFSKFNVSIILNYLALVWFLIYRIQSTYFGFLFELFVVQILSKVLNMDLIQYATRYQQVVKKNRFLPFSVGCNVRALTVSENI